MTRQEQIDFIEKLAPAAQESARRFGVPASVTLAQAILESRWGQSGLAREGNNFFGIKVAIHVDEPIAINARSIVLSCCASHEASACACAPCSSGAEEKNGQRLPQIRTAAFHPVDRLNRGTPKNFNIFHTVNIPARAITLW